MVKFFIILAVIVIVPAIILFGFLFKTIKNQQNNLVDLNGQIEKIQKFLKDNEDISSDLFDEGDEIRTGLGHNKNIYSYYTIVGTEIPKKLWLTHLKLGEKTTIEGQADNLESVYAFFRSIKDYNPESDIKLQKLGLATNSKVQKLDDNSSDVETDSILTSLNADFYEFRISNEPEVKKEDLEKKDLEKKEGDANAALPDLETIKENN